MYDQTVRGVAFAAIAAFVPAQQAAVPASAQREPVRPATILLVTSKELAPAWQTFADWKTRLGKATEILTVASITENFAGLPDTQAMIRAAVLEAIDSRGTKWVILGGDSEPDGGGVVPHRDTPHRRPIPGPLPTDVYYLSALDWDANDDRVYGDWPADREAIAYTNERASIGRIPVRTKADVEAYTQKVIAYESQYPETDFASKMLYTCPEPHAYPKVRRSWDDHVGKAWDGAVMRWFANESPFDGGGDYDLVPANFVARINEACASKMHIHGHGHLPSWVFESHGRLTAAEVGKLENAKALPIITTVSCNTGEFDSANDPSITESMLRRPGGGAIAIVAPSRPGVPVFAKRSDMRLMMTEGKLDGTTEAMTRFWVHGLSGLTTGEAFAATKADFAKRAAEFDGYHWMQCELNLLGDPSLDFRAQSPRRPKVEVPETLARYAEELVVETDAPGAVVCVWKGVECYEVGVADGDGRAVLGLSCRTGGELLVTVSGRNLNAALASVVVE